MVTGTNSVPSYHRILSLFWPFTTQLACVYTLLHKEAFFALYRVFTHTHTHTHTHTQNMAHLGVYVPLICTAISVPKMAGNDGCTTKAMSIHALAVLSCF